MSRSARRSLLFLAIGGLAAALASSYVHYRLLADPGYTSFCDVNATVSCTQVYQSRFGTLGGVPVALLGALWFALVAVLVASERRGVRGYAENVPAYVFALSTVGLAVVLYLAYASFFILKAVCVLCVATYAAVVGMFVVSGAATTFPMTTLPKRAWSDLRSLGTRPQALVMALVFLSSSALAVAFFPRVSASADKSVIAGTPAPIDQDQRSDFEKWYAVQPRKDVPVLADGASVVIVKFNDYQCPPCKQTFLDYKGIVADLQKKHAGKIKYVTKDYPLDPECNPGGGQHVAACEAAVAVRLARRNNRAQALEDWLFANQSALTPEIVKTAAREVGGVTDFDAKYKTELEGVRSDVALGKLLGVESTPTFFINGVLLKGAYMPQFFQAALEYELKRPGR